MRIIKKIDDLTIRDYVFLKSNDLSDEKSIINHFDLGKIDVKTYNLWLKDMNEVMNNIPEEFNLTLRFEYNGVEYGFIPNLSKISVGEWIDLDELSEDPVEFMSVLYRPIIKKGRFFWDKTYDIEEYSESSDILGDVPVAFYLGARFFFTNLRTTLLEILNIYIASEKIQIIKGLTLSEKKNLMKNIDGIT